MRPSFLASTARIFDLALGELLWARRTLFMAMLVGGPVLLALMARVTLADGLAVVRVNGARINSGAMFGMAMGSLYLRFIVPALGVFYGTALIADEVEDKTITYLFTRPIPRAAIVLGKYLAYLVCVLSAVLPTATIVFVLMVPFSGMAGVYGSLVKDLGMLAIGLAAYGALFLLAGVTFKRPLVAGLVFAFGWEQIALAMPGYLKYLTVAYYLQSLAPQALPAEDTLSLLQSVTREAPAIATSLFSLALVTAAALVLAMRIVERREYVLEQ